MCPSLQANSQARDIAETGPENKYVSNEQMLGHKDRITYELLRNV